MDTAYLKAIGAPRLLSVLRIVVAILFFTHGTQKLLGFPMGPNPGGPRRLDAALVRGRARNLWGCPYRGRSFVRPTASCSRASWRSPIGGPCAPSSTPSSTVAMPPSCSASSSCISSQPAVVHGAWTACAIIRSGHFVSDRDHSPGETRFPGDLLLWNSIKPGRGRSRWRGRSDAGPRSPRG